MKIKPCPRCGYQSPEIASYCTVCGEALSVDNIVELADSPADLTAAQPEGVEANRATPTPAPVEVALTTPLAPAPLRPAPAAFAPPQAPLRAKPAAAVQDTPGDKPPNPSAWDVVSSSCLSYLFTSAVIFGPLGGLLGLSLLKTDNGGGLFIMAVAGSALLIPLALSPLWVTWALWLSPLIDCLKNEPGDDNEKILWALAIFFTHMFGGILYLFIRRPQRIAKYGQ